MTIENANERRDKLRVNICIILPIENCENCMSSMARKTNKYKLLGYTEVLTFFISFVHKKESSQVRSESKSSFRKFCRVLMTQKLNLCPSLREIDIICSHREKRYPDHLQKNKWFNKTRKNMKGNNEIKKHIWNVKNFYKWNTWKIRNIMF